MDEKPIRLTGDKNQRQIYLPSLFVCLLFLVIGILFVQNEVYQDDWYIEASADGFFGETNRSLFVLGPNFVILACIWLLSLTGIRLFWLHIILIITNFLSHLMLSILLVDRMGKWTGSFLSLLIGLIIAPIVSFELQFTTTAGFAIASGCAVIFDSIDRNESKYRFILGFSLALLGSCLRFDCIAYSAVMFGLLCFLHLIVELRSGNRNIGILVRKWLTPFLVLALVAGGLEICQRVGMEIVNPGFREWNSVRTKLDDYYIPSYYENTELYETIGLSQNDYELLLSWNYQDSEVFTEDVLNALLAMQNETVESSPSTLLSSFFHLLTNSLRVMLGSVYFWAVFLLSIPLILSVNKKKMMVVALLFFSVTAFLMYFEGIGRLIWRTEWPIWTAAIASIATQYDSDINYPFKCVDNLQKAATFFIILFALLLVKPYKATQSLYEIHKGRITSDDTYCNYVINRVSGKQKTYATYDEEAAVYLSGQKNKTVYALWQKPWLQQYPIYVKDTFTFFEVGSGSNFGSLGQYFVRLAPMERTSKERSEASSFEKIVCDDTLIVARNDDNIALLSVLSTYLEEHYDIQSVFSVQKRINDVIIGRYVDTREAVEPTGSNQLIPIVRHCDEDSRFIELDLGESDLSRYEAKAVLFEIIGESNERYLASPVEGESRALVYIDSLPSGDYQVRTLMRDGSCWTASSSTKMEVRH